MIKSLAQLQSNEGGVVVELQGGFGAIRKLEAMGIRPGKRVVKVSSQPMRGPVIVSVDGYQIALGFGVASKVIVDTSLR
ncbi:MAG TPA: ferrous iron transport protein A [Candidatus Latescibacteria bacterium]|nr:ferrous iron transport protein A [Candidatus Latescibacterota bacterium]